MSIRRKVSVTAKHAEADALYKMAEVSRALKRATSTIEKLVHRVSGTNDLTLMHFLVLVHLSNAVTCQQVDLRSVMRVAPNHLTRLLDELVDRGLVCRNPSSSDRRQIILALTTPGQHAVLHLLVSLRTLTSKTQLDEIDRLSSSLEHFVSATENDLWFDRKSDGG